MGFLLYENIIQKTATKRKNNLINALVTVYHPRIKKSYEKKLENAFSKLKAIFLMSSDYIAKKLANEGI